MPYDRDFRARGPRKRDGSYGDAGAGEFEWGGGYIGGRGYGGGSYDLDHGYVTGGWGRFPIGPRAGQSRDRDYFPPAGWGEGSVGEEYGPARYGYGPYHHRLRRPRRSDDQLRQEVEDTLFYDTWLDADAISVRVEEGVVTLRGELPNYEEVRYAVDDAWDADGVRGVRTELSVREEGGRGPDRDADPERYADPQRYAAGAPHMHGHPEGGAEPESASARQLESRGAPRGRKRAPRGEAAGRKPRGRARRDDATGAGDGGPALDQD